MAEAPKLRLIEGGKQDLTEDDGRAILVTLLRQPVLSRETETKATPSPDGRDLGTKTTLKRNGYVRTKEALERRTERLVEMSATRATVTWGHMIGSATVTSKHEFALKTGRMVGDPDWLLGPDSVKRLRALAREMFPKAAKEAEEPSDAVADV